LECFLIWIFAFKISAFWMLFWVFKQSGEFIDFISLRIALLLDFDNFFGKLWDFRNKFLDYLELALSLFEFQVNHFDLLLFLSDLLFAVFKDVLLDVRLFI
jgi:hypothetical protein